MRAAYYYNPGQKSLRQDSNIRIFLSFLGYLLKLCILFEIFLPFSPPPTLYKVETQKKFWIHVSNIAFVVRAGLGLCEMENASGTQECPKTFVHDCS